MANPTTTINHVGLLVDDFDGSIARWKAATGYDYEPITRYNTTGWRDRRSEVPGEHEVRVTFSFAATPSIELMSFYGGGTHARERGEGLHHLGFYPIVDNFEKVEELRSKNVHPDGEALSDEGRIMLFFVDRDELDDVHVEYVEDGHEHPVTKDDGTPLNRLPSGEETHLDLDWLAEHADDAPGGPIITDIGIEVADIADSVRRWEAATDYRFGTPEEQRTEIRDEQTGKTVTDEVIVASSTLTGPRIDLIQRREGPARRPTFGFDVPDGLDAHRARLEAAGIRIDATRHDDDGQLVWFITNPDDLNNIGFVFRNAA